LARYLLLGAGFSYNWGGWLASEAFEYLLGCEEIIKDPSLSALLWRHRDRGGFEDALSELQREAAQWGDSSKHPALQALQSAVTSMFDMMNRGYLYSGPFDGEGPNFIGSSMARFLSRFDAIFTLNQDLLLEYKYLPDGATSSAGRWRDLTLPGLRPIDRQVDHDVPIWARLLEPLTPADALVSDRTQPIYKLHGSANWRANDGSGLLIIGGRKENAIIGSQLLSQYMEIFQRRLSGTNSRLMTVGYSFRDEHINAIITSSIELGLKIFIVGPDGAGTPALTNPAREGMIVPVGDLEASIRKGLIGASRRPIRTTIKSDRVEMAKFERFLAE